jgi:hypothetical protein
MKTLLTLSVIFLVSACASREPQEVRCDIRLQPINLPKSKSSALVAPARIVP